MGRDAFPHACRRRGWRLNLQALATGLDGDRTARTTEDRLLINVARGGIVDQTALHAALESGKLGRAGLDVTDPEPLPTDDPLWSAPNLLISPHYAGAGSLVSQQRLADGAGENLERSIAGTALVNQVRL